ncbi:hypothetical protein OUZ56_009471 [Daphnia magna]|uniref:Uncharacterized protein n=1 Tax=Daphnia magna TaxID=35525 RepID=A0ABR0AG42_9CRUS|nr:hypothetical protein OUZ56_009471 [Daphnia magna]
MKNRVPLPIISPIITSSGFGTANPRTMGCKPTENHIVQYPAQKSEHRFNFLKPPMGGRLGRRGDGHIGQGWGLGLVILLTETIKLMFQLPVNVNVVVNGVGVAFLNVILEIGV